jgi:hypothetical protein
VVISEMTTVLPWGSVVISEMTTGLARGKGSVVISD